MKLDLRNDFDDIYAYVVRRVQSFGSADNKGPGDATSPVALVELGYQCDQAGWVALVFDTRLDATPCGEWNSYIEENLFERPFWQEASDSLETEAVDFVLPDGSVRTVSPSMDENEYMAIFGELLRDVLLKARQEGVFESLPKARGCLLCVEEHDGRYGWPGFENLGKNNLA